MKGLPSKMRNLLSTARKALGVEMSDDDAAQIVGKSAHTWFKDDPHGDLSRLGFMRTPPRVPSLLVIDPKPLRPAGPELYRAVQVAIQPKGIINMSTDANLTTTAPPSEHKAAIEAALSAFRETEKAKIVLIKSEMTELANVQHSIRHYTTLLDGLGEPVKPATLDPVFAPPIPITSAGVTVQTAPPQSDK